MFFNADQMKILHFMTLANCGTVSIAIFLHTLRFKKLIEPKLGYGIYTILAYTPYYGVLLLAPVLLSHWEICVIALVGMILNFSPMFVQHAYQILVLIGFSAYRFKFLTESQLEQYSEYYIPMSIAAVIISLTISSISLYLENTVESTKNETEENLKVSKPLDGQ